MIDRVFFLYKPPLNRGTAVIPLFVSLCHLPLLSVDVCVGFGGIKGVKGGRHFLMSATEKGHMFVSLCYS